MAATTVKPSALIAALVDKVPSLVMQVLLQQLARLEKSEVSQTEFADLLRRLAGDALEGAIQKATEGGGEPVASPLKKAAPAAAADDNPAEGGEKKAKAPKKPKEAKEKKEKKEKKAEADDDEEPKSEKKKRKDAGKPRGPYKKTREKMAAAAAAAGAASPAAAGAEAAGTLPAPVKAE